MEKYEYVILAKSDCMGNFLGEGEEQKEELLKFSLKRMEELLALYGKEGYRIITKLYNSPDDWVLILSRLFTISGR